MRTLIPGESRSVPTVVATSRPVRSIAALLAAAVLTATSLAGEHPRLIIRKSDLPRVREAAARELGAADAKALREWLARPPLEASLHGEMLAAAAMHLVHEAAGARSPGPESGSGDATRSAGSSVLIDRVANGLREPPGIAHDALESVIALDWCWDALDPATRAEALLELRRRAKPLAPGESPLEHLVFRERLAGLALALMLEGEAEAKDWEGERREILDAARTWMTDTLPKFIEWRGRTPTSNAAAAFEESDTILAVELGCAALGEDLWPRYRASLGRWMEHYVYERASGAEHPPFVHDDGQDGALLPVATWSGLQPISAHLLAARTRDPAAASMADHVEAAIRSSTPRSATPWRWTPLFFSIADVPRCDERRLPALRNLDGALVMKTQVGERPAVIHVQGTQPLLRRRQHFDAGSFLVYCGGLLAVEGGDDVALEAVPARGGMQRLGIGKDDFSFEQYFASTVAHNAMIFWEQTGVSRWYGESFVPVGGQRPVEGTCEDFATAIENTPRRRGRLLACGMNGGDAYAALDLAAAYDARIVRSYTREFVLLDGGVLVVIDRATLAGDRTYATFILNLPQRPQVDGGDLAPERRIAGDSNDAGVWTYDDAKWLRTAAGDGSLFVRPLLPAGPRVFAVGGPGELQTVESGLFKGRRYMGGSDTGFERLVIPSARRGAQNAWYRLGSPNLLGGELQRLQHWGRIEIEPSSPSERVFLLTAIVLSDDPRAAQPPFELRRADSASDALVIECVGKDRIMRIELDRARAAGKVVRGSAEWDFPEAVESGGPLPIR